MIYQFPIRNKDSPITKELSIAIFDFILNAIRQELPNEQQPEQLAESLIAIANQYGVPICSQHDDDEDKGLIGWLHFKRLGKEFTAASFKRWAEAYEDTRSQVLAAAVKPGFCSNCGMPLQLGFCTSCGEQNA